jgi:hypothetical protein
MGSKMEVDKVSALVIASIMKELTGFNLGDKANKGSSRKSKMTTKIRGHASTADKYQIYLTDSIWTGLQDIKKYLLNKRKDYGNRGPEIHFGNNLLRTAPNIPNHHPMRPGNTTPVAHNNAHVSKDTFPPNLEARMSALKWI